MTGVQTCALPISWLRQPDNSDVLSQIKISGDTDLQQKIRKVCLNGTVGARNGYLLGNLSGYRLRHIGILSGITKSVFTNRYLQIGIYESVFTNRYLQIGIYQSRIELNHPLDPFISISFLCLLWYKALLTFAKSNPFSCICVG